MQRRVFPVLLMIGVVGGCRSFESCPAPPEELMVGESIPPITAPLGLETPDTSGALRIPEINEPERPRDRGEGCLDSPPSYFPDRRVGAESEKPPG